MTVPGYTTIGSVPLPELPHICSEMLPHDPYGFTDHPVGEVLQCDFCGTVWVCVPAFRLSDGKVMAEWQKVGWWQRRKLRHAQMWDDAVLPGG